jgi:eukaryotic-like serine/threonine-protein kinase
MREKQILAPAEQCREPAVLTGTPPPCSQAWRRSGTLASLGLLLSVSNMTGADWPMFRGNPALTGVAEGALAEKPALLWTFKTGGPAKSSPALVDNKVFCGSDDENVYALNLADGKKLWTFKTGGSVESSPLVLGSKVFVGSSDAFLYALEAGSGRLLWKYETGEKILGAPNWFKLGDRIAVLVGSYDFKLHCLDVDSGKTNWVYETGNYINGSPAVAGGVTVFGGCDALLHVLSLKDGTMLKEVEAGAYIAASAALVEGRAYFGQYENEFLCVDIGTGNKAWTYHKRDFPFFSSPAVTKDLVLVGGRDKRLHCMKRDDGAPVWEFTTRGKVDSSPVVCGQKVLIGSDDGRLYLVDLRTGKELWQYQIGQPISGSPAVAGGKFVIGADDGSIYCFGSK